MEVCLLSNSGVPDDAIISVRAGSVRKQGTVGSCKAFGFPSGEENRLKFDVMSRIGAGNLVLKPASIDASSVYKVTLSDEMSCEVQVNRSGEHPPSTNLGLEDSPVKISAAAGAKDAKDYLESKGLLSFLQGVLHVVIKEKPDDPYTYMARCFMNGFDDVPHATGHGLETNGDEKVCSQATVHKDDGDKAKSEKTAECKEAPATAGHGECEKEKEQVVDKEESAPPPDLDRAAASVKEETKMQTVASPPAAASPALEAQASAPASAALPAATLLASQPAPDNKKEVMHHDPPSATPASQQQSASNAYTSAPRHCGGYVPVMAHPFYAPEAPMMMSYPMSAGAICNGMPAMIFI